MNGQTDRLTDWLAGLTNRCLQSTILWQWIKLRIWFCPKTSFLPIKRATVLTPLPTFVSSHSGKWIFCIGWIYCRDAFHAAPYLYRCVMGCSGVARLLPGHRLGTPAMEAWMAHNNGVNTFDRSPSHSGLCRYENCWKVHYCAWLNYVRLLHCSLWTQPHAISRLLSNYTWTKFFRIW